MQLSGAQLNYPVHEKELLAIICALKKWRTDLLGSSFEVYTDHRTLENFNKQQDLSRRQAHWMELMSQYDFSISYICGEDNTVADALSCLPVTEPEPVSDADPNEVQLNNWSQWSGSDSSVNAVLNIEIHKHILDDIKLGYTEDPFCKKFISGQSILPNVKELNGLWYIVDRLLIPHFHDIREHLFRLAHDSLGHAGLDKAYAALRDSYY